VAHTLYIVLWVNYKTYPKGMADSGLAFSLMCEEVSDEVGVNVIICPQVADIYRISQRVNLEIWAQHVDPLEPGRGTGFILAESVLKAGASGALINHSEHPITKEKMKETLDHCQTLGLRSMVFVPDIDSIAMVSELGPDFIAFEPPELVSGDVSVSTAENDEIKKAVEMITNSGLIVGAGVHDYEDVKLALESGAVGVLVSSALMEKSEDPRSLLMQLLEPFQA